MLTKLNPEILTGVAGSNKAMGGGSAGLDGTAASSGFRDNARAAQLLKRTATLALDRRMGILVRATGHSATSRDYPEWRVAANVFRP